MTSAALLPCLESSCNPTGHRRVQHLSTDSSGPVSFVLSWSIACDHFSGQLKLKRQWRGQLKLKCQWRAVTSGKGLAVKLRCMDQS